LKYNPLGQKGMRDIFLKYNNYNHGAYLAQLTKQVMDDLESNKYQFAEYRLSIYGRDKTEWSKLGAWVVNNSLFHANVRWMIQIPRLYRVYKKEKTIKNFKEMLDNIFLPLFEVTVDPSTDHKLHLFLKSCVGFDSVDDESIRERPYKKGLPIPMEWNKDLDPPYAMFSYYIAANLIVLNKLRQSKGMTTFAYRPHSGEAGDVEHLAAGFLLARSINHGLVLQRCPALQYLYYLAQIGISMSPLSNNLLFIEYHKNPFPRFFARGLFVTLSTDDPLMIHVTKEPLVEEYSVAAQVWKFTAIDTCEIARNSVLQSGFEDRFKSHWLGCRYWERSVAANDIRASNVPNIRVEYRLDMLTEELKNLSDHANESVGFELIDPL